MTTTERLRITLPKALDLGNLQIAARRFDTMIHLNARNGFDILKLVSIDYTPTVAKVQLWTYNRGLESSQVGGIDGHIPYDRDIDNSEPIQLAFFNLTTESEINLTLLLVGELERVF